MKIDWRFILVIIAALVTILALKTQTENLDGDVESEDESEEEKEEEEEEVKAEVPKAAYPDVKGFIGSMGDIPGKVKYVDLHMIKGFLDDVSVGDDTTSFSKCTTKCSADVLGNPKLGDVHEECKTECKNFTSSVCRIGCKLDPDDKVCSSDGLCGEFLP